MNWSVGGEFSPFDAYWTTGGILTEAAPELGLGLVSAVSEIPILAYRQSHEPIDRADALLRLYHTIAFGHEDLIKFTQRFLEQAKYDPKYAEALTFVLGYPLNLDPRARLTAPPLNNDPTAQAILGMINERGEIVVSVDQLKALFQSELQNVQTGIGENLALLQQLTANQGELHRYMTNAGLRASKQALIAPAISRHQQKIDAAKASAYILSTFVGFQQS